MKCKRIFIIAICNGPYKTKFDSFLLSYAEFSEHDGAFISMAVLTIILPNSGPVGIINITEILCLAKEFKTLYELHTKYPLISLFSYSYMAIQQHT